LRLTTMDLAASFIYGPSTTEKQQNSKKTAATAAHLITLQKTTPSVAE